jgi:hypothetical protein
MASGKNFAQFCGRKAAGAGAVATLDRRMITGSQSLGPGAAAPGRFHGAYFPWTLK